MDRLSKYILYTVFATAPLLQGCAPVKNALSTESGNPAVTAEELASRYKPEGYIEERIHNCTIDGPSHRRLMVYLPKSYRDSTSKRYPVLYLLHGARGNESSWFTKGHIVSIIDSLTREGLVKEFITVLPNVNSYKDDDDFGNSRFKNPIESFWGTNGSVEQAFVTDVVNFIDSTYRTIPEKSSRAISGLSVGGLQSIFISAHNPQDFGYVGIFSGFYKAPTKKGPNSDYYKHIKQMQRIQFSDPPQVYLLMIGTADFFYPHNEYFRQYLTLNGFKFQYYETGGGHDWPNWVEYFTVFVQRCF